MSSEEAHQAWVPCSAGVPSPACSPRGRARDLAGFLATHPKPLPCSKTPAELTRPRPYRPCQHRPPGKPNRRPQRGHNLEANTGLQLPLSTLHERRRRPPCKTRFRLAGCASTGRESNPLDRFERFPTYMSSSFPGLTLTQAGRMRGASFSTWHGCRRRQSQSRQSNASMLCSPSSARSTA